MSSATSTKPGQIFALLSMAAATVAVMVTNYTHPAALLVMSGGILACGLAAYFFHTALYSLVGPKRAQAALTGQRRETLAADKNRILHTIKEIEFDHRMGKINARDFDVLSTPLRRKAAMLMEELDRIDESDAETVVAPAELEAGGDRVCEVCATSNDVDAKFCKSCGAKL